MADHDDRIEHQHGGGADAFLGRGSHVNGTLVFRGAVHIEGDVEGEIAADGVVTIAASAVVNARIAATSIVIQGRVTGEIVARERLEIRGPARVSGSVATPRLVIHEGAVFEGRCTMRGAVDALAGKPDDSNGALTAGDERRAKIAAGGQSGVEAGS